MAGIDEVAALKLYNGVIHYDEANGFGGAAIYPIGTADKPVNNTADLLALWAAYPSIKIVEVHGDISFAAGPAITVINFIGSGAGISTFSALNRDLNDCVIQGFDVNIDTLTGNLIFENCGTCNIDDVTGGLIFERCGNITFAGTITGDISCISCGNITGATIVGDVFTEFCGTVGITSVTGTLIHRSGGDINIIAIDAAPGIIDIAYSGNVFLGNITGGGIRIHGCRDVQISIHSAGGTMQIWDCHDVVILNESNTSGVSIMGVDAVALGAVTGTYVINKSGVVALNNNVAASTDITIFGTGDTVVNVPNTNTDGTLTLFGRVRVTNQTGGMRIYDYRSIRELVDQPLADRDEFDVTVAMPINTERWTGEVYIGALEGSGADTNTAVLGKAVIWATPTTPLETGYWLRQKPVRSSKFYEVIVDASYTWGTPTLNGSYGGIAVTKGSAYDANNYVMLVRQKTSLPTDRLLVQYMFGGAGGFVPLTVTEDAFAFKIERWGNIWRFYYSTSLAPDYNWHLITQLEDTANAMTRSTSIALLAHAPAVLLEWVTVEFDNFRYAEMFGNLEDIISANPAYVHDPSVDQADIIVAQVGLIKNKPSAAPIQIAEITTPGLIRIWRYRQGVDVNWTLIVAGAGMAAMIGGVYFTYTFPNASWQNGDKVLYEIYDTVVTLNGQTFNLSTVQGFGVIGVPTLLLAMSHSFQEQADVAVNTTAVNASETDIFDLSVASTRYIVRSLRLKCADPGANTVTVRLYELVNDVLTEVDSFAIDSTNFTTYHSLMDMFGMSVNLAGDNLKVTVRASAGGPYTVTGQYSFATAT